MHEIWLKFQKISVTATLQLISGNSFQKVNTQNLKD